MRARENERGVRGQREGGPEEMGLRGKGPEKNGRGDWIRTSDSCLPKTVLYQAELHPDGGFLQVSGKDREAGCPRPCLPAATISQGGGFYAMLSFCAMPECAVQGCRPGWCGSPFAAGRPPRGVVIDAGIKVWRGGHGRASLRWGLPYDSLRC